MDKTCDVILGVLSGTQYLRSYPGVEQYISSIQRSGFSGRKVMIAWNIHPQTRAYLLQYGFEIVEATPYPSDRFFHARMRLCWEYLKDHHQEFRYVFFLDVKDLVMQSDPSLWMDKNVGKASIIGATESLTVGEEETVRTWALSVLGEEKYQEIKDCEYINGGTFAGDAAVMTELFHEVHLLCKGYTGPYPPCQISVTYSAHTKFKDVLRMPRMSEGFTATTHTFWSPWRVPSAPFLRDLPHVMCLEDGLLYPGEEGQIVNSSILFSSDWGKDKAIKIVPVVGNLYGVGCIEKPKSKPFAIVHGADRDWGMKSLFDFKYRFHGDWDWAEFKDHNDAMLDLERAAFRRPLRIPTERESFRGPIRNPIEGAVVGIPSAPGRFKRKP